MIKHSSNSPHVKPRVGNVSAESDACFMAELKRTNPARYARLIEAIHKQVLKARRQADV